MATYLAPTAIAELTQATLDGTGVFDVLMRANKVHLEAEFSKNRIKGSEYATVYLGSLEAVLQASLQFLLQREKNLAEIALIEAQTLKVEAEILLIGQQTANAVVEGTVLTAQKCKLDAEFDLLKSNVLKSAQETMLLLWKTNTEKAQTTALGVDDNSVVGKQKALYAAQTTGFTRDAEQKAAKVMVDSWSVRRTTDEATVANGTNKLDDSSVGRAVNKLLGGVGA
jgi:hypothetical protein